jgi:putative NADH-flavin reductase
VHVLILGASGRTGRCLVNEAIERGHVVTAFVHRRAPDAKRAAACRILAGDVLEPKSVEAAVLGQDAVFWCVGPSGRDAETRLCSEGTDNVLRAMQRGGARRLICETGFGAGESRWGGPYARVLRIVLRGRVDDKDRQEESIRKSGVEWVIVRPTILTNGPRTGKYRVGDDLRVGWLPRVSRADVAEFMSRQLTDATHVHHAVGITGR